MISVVMPVFNTKKDWLEKAVESILNQSFKEFELLIVDNDSDSSSTLETLTKYKSNPLIKVLYSPKKVGKRGVSTSLNIGILESKYDFIARMDSDDEMRPNRLEEQINFLIKNPEIDVLGSQMYIIQQNHFTKHPEVIDETIITKYNRDWFLNHPTIMFRKSLFKKIGLYAEEPEFFAEDLELWSRCLINNIQIRNLSACLLDYNLHDHNTSTLQSLNPQWINNIKECKQKVIEKFGKIPMEEEPTLSNGQNLLNPIDPYKSFLNFKYSTKKKY
jgi:glycosyltransferase involved in cell wall biosynthesis